MIMPLPVVVPPDGVPQSEHTATLDALLHSLGLAAAACRAAILHVRTGQILNHWVEHAGFPFRPASPPPPTPDVFVTNWNQYAPQLPIVGDACGSAFMDSCTAADININSFRIEGNGYHRCYTVIKHENFSRTVTVRVCERYPKVPAAPRSGSQPRVWLLL